MRQYKKLRWITETALLLALLIILQAVTKSFGQLVTGTCVNAILAIAVLYSGIGSGMTVALLSPVFAWLLGIAPQILTVPAIMAANAVYVGVLWAITGGQTERFKRALAACLLAAAAKFVTLYAIVVLGICKLLADTLTAQGLLKKPMLAVLTANFSWPQLVTALLGGTLAFLIAPALKKALKR